MYKDSLSVGTLSAAQSFAFCIPRTVLEARKAVSCPCPLRFMQRLSVHTSAGCLQTPAAVDMLSRCAVQECTISTLFCGYALAHRTRSVTELTGKTPCRFEGNQVVACYIVSVHAATLCLAAAMLVNVSWHTTIVVLLCLLRFSRNTPFLYALALCVSATPETCCKQRLPVQGPGCHGPRWHQET